MIFVNNGVIDHELSNKIIYGGNFAHAYLGGSNELRASLELSLCANIIIIKPFKQRQKYPQILIISISLNQTFQQISRRQLRIEPGDFSHLSAARVRRRAAGQWSYHGRAHAVRLTLLVVERVRREDGLNFKSCRTRFFEEKEQN